MNRNAKVLLVEDDGKLRSTVADYLQMNDFLVTACDGGSAALSAFRNETFDIVLLDGMLPDLDGFEVLKRIREVSDVPVIMLSARESERDQLNGFHLGADNYITKPFLLSVLKEHICALLTRAGHFDKNKNHLRKGSLVLDTTQRKVYLAEELILTTPREYDLLLYFMQNEKIVLTRDTILDRVWGDAYFGDLRTVDTIVKQLRKKLGKYGDAIVSIYGIGYKFEVKNEE